MTRQQFTRFQDNAVGTGVENVDPEFLVEYLASEDKHLDTGVHLLCRATQFDADGGGTAQSEVKQYEVGQLLF